jgi:hypothetical protein
MPTRVPDDSDDCVDPDDEVAASADPDSSVNGLETESAVIGCSPAE